MPDLDILEQIEANARRAITDAKQTLDAVARLRVRLTLPADDDAQALARHLPTGSPPDAKSAAQRHRDEVLAYLRAHPKSTSQQIAEATGILRARVADALTWLMERKLVVKAGTTAGLRGQATQYAPKGLAAAPEPEPPAQAPDREYTPTPPISKRVLHRRRVLTALREKPGLLASELVDVTGMDRLRVAEALRDLAADNEIEKTGVRRRRAGVEVGAPADEWQALGAPAEPAPTPTKAPGRRLSPANAAAEANRARILAWLQEHPGALQIEIRQALNIEKSRVSDAVRYLAAEGLIAPTGTKRRAAGVAHGPARDEWQALGAVLPAPEPEPPAQPAPAEPEPEPEPEPEEAKPVGKDPPAITSKTGQKITYIDALNAAADLKRFTRREYAARLDVSPLAVARFLQTMLDRTLVTMDGTHYIADMARRVVERRPAPAPAPEAEDIPADLAAMPALHRGGPGLGAQQIGAARREKAVYDLAAQGPILGPEVAQTLDIPKPSIVNILASLEAAGLLKRTGRLRWPAGRPAVGGRQAVEYVRADWQGELPEPEPEPEDLTGNEAAVLAKVRDWTVKQGTGEAFSVPAAAAAVELPRDAVLAALEALAARNVVTDESPAADFRLFRYAGRPTDPGTAADVEAKRRAANGQADQGGAQAVAGTGKKMVVTDPDVRSLITDCQRAGATVSRATNSHYAVEKEGMKRVLISSTPRSRRSVLNDRARLRREGLRV